MKHYTFRDTLPARSDASIKDIGFKPAHMVVITQAPKNTMRIEKRGPWSEKQVGIFNPNSVEVKAEIKFYG
jgi:hypothetical protein